MTQEEAAACSMLFLWLVMPFPWDFVKSCTVNYILLKHYIQWVKWIAGLDLF